MSKKNPLLDPYASCNIESSDTLEKYPKGFTLNLKEDLQLVEKKTDPRIISDPVIATFLEFILKRYRIWFYLRGIPKIAIPMFITGCQRLLSSIYITGCKTTDDGVDQPVSSCIACNNNQITHPGNTSFRYFDYIAILSALIIISIILRRGISEAHLCLRALKYNIHVRASWYYWNHILLIGTVAIMCASLSLISSVLLSNFNAEEAFVDCHVGELIGRRIRLTLSDYGENLLFWISLYIISVVSYWPIIKFLVDLYDTPLLIFIEPEDLFKYNGEIKSERNLLERLSRAQNKVRLRFLVEEINQVYKEMKKMKPFTIESIPDEYFEVAILRLYNKRVMKTYKKKIENSKTLTN